MTEPSPQMNLLIHAFSYIPLTIYFIVAILLTVVAVISIYDAVLLIKTLFDAGNLATGLVQVVYAILLTITVIVLFETVTVYFRTKHVPVRSLLVAGLTGTIRQTLVINYSTVADTIQLFAIIGILAVLIAGVVLVKEE